MLYGRDVELSQIGMLLDGARGSHSGVLVLRGEAGVGKTALLQDAGDRASDMRVLVSRGVELETQLPFAAIHQLTRPILSHVGALPEPQARALRGALGEDDVGSGERFLVSLAVLSLLAEAAEEAPVLCLIDDAQWLDDASADALVFVARRLEAERIAMLFAAREGEARLFEAPGLPELALTGLDPEAGRALLEDHAPSAVAPDVRDRLIEGTGGNPLALLELPLTEPQFAGTEPVLDPLPVSARVERSFLARVRGLPDDTQTLLLVAAAEDTGVLPTVLRAARQLGAGAESVDAAEQAGLIQVRERRLEFRHPLVRSAVYHGAPHSRRQSAHGALAEALDGESDADRRAWHRAAASVDPSPQVGDDLEQAAERARRRSGFAAASLAFERAAVLTPGEKDRARRLIAAAESAWFAGRSDRAEMLYTRARPLASDPVQLADIDRGRALIEVTRGIPADACRTFTRAAANVAPVDGERALYMLGLGSVAGAYGGDRETVVGMADKVKEVPPSGTPVARFLREYVRGVAGYFAEDFGDAGRSMRIAVELADDADAAGAARFPGLLIVAGAAAMFLGDAQAGRVFHSRLAARTRDTGALSLLTQTLPRLALSDIFEGHWQSADAALREALVIASDIDQSQVVGHAWSERAIIAALRGEEHDCRLLAALGRERAVAQQLVHVNNLARWALIVLELGLGKADEAFVAARELTEAPIALWAGLDRVEAAVRTGERGTARRWLAPFEAWAEGSGVAWPPAVVLQCRALLSEQEAEAERLFAAALEAHAGAGRPFERARCELAFGEFLRRARRRVDAREHLRAAVDGFEALGARQWAERGRVELRASGQRARKRDPSTLDELTAQEIQIAKFVAQGLTNREVAAQLYLSPRTIDYHLRNVFSKLGIASRTELARLDLGGATGGFGEEARPAIPPVPA